MNKKFLGIRVATYLQAFVCVLVAFCIWFFAGTDDNKLEPEGEEAVVISCESFDKI